MINENEDKKLYEIKCSHCKQPIKYKRSEKPEKCYLCNHPYSMKPPMEYRLFKIQDKFLNDIHNEKVFKKFHLVLSAYIRRIILKKIKNKVFLTKEMIDEKVHDTISKLYIYYSRPGFKIEGSFGGYIGQVLLDVLYNRKQVNEDGHDSLNYKIAETEKRELIDTMFSYGYHTLMEHEHDVEKEVLDKDNFIINDIMNQIDVIINKELKNKYSIKDICLYLLGLYFILNKDSKQFDEFNEVLNDDIKILLNKTKDDIKRILKDKINE